MRFILLGVSVVVLSTFAEEPAIHDVIINEFVTNDAGLTTYESLGGRTINGDWIELLVVNGPVDLRGCYLDDNNTQTGSIEGEIHFTDSAYLNELETGTYVLIIAHDTGTDSIDLTNNVLVLYSGNGVIETTTDPGYNLSATNDNLCLVTASGMLIDFVSEATSITPSSYTGLPSSVLWMNAPGNWADDNGMYFTHANDGSFINDDWNAGWYRVTASLFSQLTPGTVNTGQDDASLPVELDYWNVESRDGCVKLLWSTQSEIQNQGFIIERQSGTSSPWTEIASFITHSNLLGQGSSTVRKQYQFIDNCVLMGATYSYRLLSVDYNSEIDIHPTITVTVQYSDHTTLPVLFQFHDAYPNPFNAEVIIPFTLRSDIHDPLSFGIYDVYGRPVFTIAEEYYSEGTHTFYWNGMTNGGQEAVSGVYIARLASGRVGQAQRLILLK